MSNIELTIEQKILDLVIQQDIVTIDMPRHVIIEGDVFSDGKSAYQIALDNGFIGTEVERLESLKGDDGDPGDPGPQGPQGPSGVANNGQATTWDGGNTAVDLGGTYDKNIDIASYNGRSIATTSFDSLGQYYRSYQIPPESGDTFWGQYGESINAEFVASLSSFQASMRVFNGTDTNRFIVDPTTLYSSQYPDSRDESGSYRPRNVIYTDDSGYFRSSSLPGFWTQLKPNTSSRLGLSTGTFATSGLYTASAGIAVTSGGISVTGGNIVGTQCVMNVTNGSSFSTTHNLTGTNSQTTWSIAETWNTTGTPILFDVSLTDTASNANSLFLDFKKGGISQFKVNKFGQGTINQMTIGTFGIVSNTILPSVNGFLLLNSGRTWSIGNSAVSNLYLKVNEVLSTATSGTLKPVTLSTNFAPTSGTAAMSFLTIDGVINQTGGANGITRGLHINPTVTAAADFRAIETNVASGTGRRATRHEGTASTFQAGKETFDATNTATGTTGNQTINKPSGTVNFAAGATSLVVTNSMCATTSIVYAVVRTNDATAVIKNVVPAAGSFTINLTAAATAETSVGFIIYN